MLNPQQTARTGCCGEELSPAPQPWTADVSPRMQMPWQVPPLRQQHPVLPAFAPDTVMRLLRPQLAELYIHRQSFWESPIIKIQGVRNNV